MPVFPATSAVSGGSGQITLADIERAATVRLGPHFLGASGLGEEQSAGTAAMVSRAYFDELVSSAGVGDVADLYMLRRGNKADGTTVAVAASDRQRLVAEYNSTDGSVVPDRNWTVQPVSGELVEFHHLDPARMLRPAVRAGLRRCYFETREAVTLSGAAAERDVTSVVSWITLPKQVRRVQFAATGSTMVPDDQDWWRPFASAGHVWLAGWRDAFPNTLYLTALRPHFTWVNGASSTTGPTADDDLLSLDLNYAVAAAHIEAWRMYPARLKEAADAGYQINQQAAADEFSRQAADHISRKPRQWSLSAPFNPTPALTQSV